MELVTRSWQHPTGKQPKTVHLVCLGASHHDYDQLWLSPDTPDILANADALAIITDWSEYRNPDFDRIKAALKNPLVVDGRNLYKPDRMASAGFSYIPLGRCGGTICGEVK